VGGYAWSAFYPREIAENAPCAGLSIRSPVPSDTVECMSDNPAKAPDDDNRAHSYFIGYLQSEIELTGSISRRQWDNAVEAANRYKRSLTGEKPPKREEMTP
jgi:hypothetical protein